MQAGAEFFGDDAGLDHRHTGPAVFRRHQQPGGAEIGKASPDLFGHAGRIVEQLAHMTRNRGLFRKIAPRRIAQRHLLIGEFEIHFRGNPSTRCAVMFLLIWVVPPAIVSERDVRR